MKNKTNKKHVEDNEKIRDTLYAISMATTRLFSMLVNGKISFDDYIKGIQQLSDGGKKGRSKGMRLPRQDEERTPRV